jgi:hypothetical protein
VLSAAAVVLWAAGAFAQAKPDLSGSWTLDQEKTTAANPNAGGGGGGRRGGGGGGGGAMTIKQDATSITIETQGRQGAQSTTYPLNGSEVQVPGGRGSAATAKAMVEGSTIVINTTRQMEDNTVTTKAVYSMEGEWLVIATTGPGRGGGEPTTTKRYYKKGM